MHFYRSTKTSNSRTRNVFRSALVESLESRCLLAADPILLKDLNEAPNPSESSYQVDWNYGNDFLASINGEVHRGFTDGSGAGTTVLENLGSVNKIRLDSTHIGFKFIHISDPGSGVTSFQWLNSNHLPTTPFTLPYETNYLGAVGDAAILQRLDDFSIQSLKTMQPVTLATPTGLLNGVVKANWMLVGTVNNPNTGNTERWEIPNYYDYYLGWQHYAMTTGIVAADVSFLSDDFLFSTNNSGELNVFFNPAQPEPTSLGNFGEKVQDIDFDFSARTFSFLVYRAESNTTDLYRAKLNGSAFLVHTFAGFGSSIDDMNSKLIKIESGMDSGYWWLDHDGSLLQDTALDNMVGPVHRLNNAILGWSEFEGFGSELAVYSPDPVIRLMNPVIVEAAPAGSFVENFWLDWTYDPATWELVSGTGDANNSYFTLTSSGALFTARSLDFETTPQPRIRVRATLATGGIFEKSVAIFVQDAAEVITLTNDRVGENSANALIGLLNVQNFPHGEVVTYSIVSVDGQEGNAGKFQVTGNRLETISGLDFETQNQYSLIVQATATSGVTLEWPLVIHVENVNENSTSAITISNDSILEESPAGATIGSLGVQGQSGQFVYSLVDGDGSYDNWRFSIVDGSLVLNELPNFEAKRSYSVRIEANGGEQPVADHITIDVLPVDEYSTEGINFAHPEGGLFDFFRLVENTPIGTHVLTLEANDADQGEAYQWSITGGLSQYLRLENDLVFVNSAINFEAVTDWNLMDFRATVVSRSGQITTRWQPGGTYENSSHFHPSIIDVNDPPVVAPVANQTALAGDETSLLLNNPLYTDEDIGAESGGNVELFVGSNPAPEWIQINPTSGTLLVSPSLTDAGDYTVILRVTDVGGAIDEKTFLLAIAPLNVNTVLGTSGDDSFVVRPNNAAATSWSVLLNNQLVYSGLSSPSNPLAIDGEGGDDSIIIEGSQRGNDFTLHQSSVTVGSSRIYQTGIESREVRGRAGADRFQTTTDNYRITTTIRGGNGRDVVVGPDSGSIAFWVVFSNGGGQIGNANFTGISVLQGSNSDDFFEFGPSGRISEIQGGGGFNAVRYVDYTTTASSVNMTSLASQAGSATRIDEFDSISTFIAPPNPDNRISLSSSSVGNGSSSQWEIFYDTVQLSTASSSTRTTPIEFRGFGILEGSNRDDEFIIDYAEDPFYRIIGRGGNNSLTYRSMYGYIDLENNVGHGIRSFETLQTFVGTQGGSVAGPNQPTVWQMTDEFVRLSNGHDFIGFTNFYGGTSGDVFKIEYSPERASTDEIHGNEGRNTLDYSDYSAGVQVNINFNYATSLIALSNFSVVYGSAFDDSIGGSYEDDLLVGLGGDDFLEGYDGNDVLLGGLGNDSLFGHDGRDWLIGGLGADVLEGNEGQDILIACSAAPTFESNGRLSSAQVSRIDSVMAEWTGPRSYAQRVQRLSNGTGGLPRLSASNLTNDNRIDRLLGREDRDWFWASNQDLLEDQASDEIRSQP